MHLLTMGRFSVPGSRIFFRHKINIHSVFILQKNAYFLFKVFLKVFLEVLMASSPAVRNGPNYNRRCT